MKTNTIPERVGEHVVRGIATQVSLLLAIAISAGVSRGMTLFTMVVSIFLLADFTARATGLSRISLLAIVSRGLQGKVFFYNRRLITAKPKKFAAAIGATMSLTSVVLWFFSLYQIQFIVLSVLLVFSFLEAAFRFCAGCKIFGLLIKLGLAREELCDDCVFPPGEAI